MNDKDKWVSVSVYAEQKGITKQAVYNSINAGRVKSKIIDGQKYVYFDGTRRENQKQSVEDNTQRVIDALLRQIEEKDRQIERQQQLLEEHIKLAKEINETTKALRELVQNEQMIQARAQYLLKEQRETERETQPAAETPAAPAPDAEPQQRAEQDNILKRFFTFGSKRK